MLRPPGLRLFFALSRRAALPCWSTVGNLRARLLHLISLPGLFGKSGKPEECVGPTSPAPFGGQCAPFEVWKPLLFLKSPPQRRGGRQGGKKHTNSQCSARQLLGSLIKARAQRRADAPGYWNLTAGTKEEEIFDIAFIIFDCIPGLGGRRRHLLAPGSARPVRTEPVFFAVFLMPRLERGGNARDFKAFSAAVV